MKIDPAGLSWRDAHTLAVGAVVPRPIAFVSTIGQDGVFNVAPFSFFASMANKPMLIGFTVATTRDGQKKDTLVNIETSGEFVLNVVTESLAEAMNQTAMNYPSDVDEFKETELTPVAADLVKPPMVGESPVNMECRLLQVMEFAHPPMISSFIIGEILRVHIKDEFYADGSINMAELKAIGRMGGDLYCRTRDIFEMKRPDK
jgi:flavin reductase (DIM6/NTAB) family NADH-FMN oxidoreductase RutF